MTGIGRGERALAAPLFFLYGEPRRSVTPRFLHVEALEVRSRPLDWAIRPHAHGDLHQLFLIADGGGRMQSDGRQTGFVAPCLLLLPAGTIHAFHFERETRGQVLTLAHTYLQDLLARAPELAPVFGSHACLPAQEPAAIAAALEALAREVSWSAPGCGAATEAHLLVVLVQALRLRCHEQLAARPVAGRAARLVARLREAIEERFRTGASVEAYAASLLVTPSTLRRACAETARMSPVQMIQDRLFLEAQRLLLYSNLSIGEVAERLGFADPAYFSRQFAKRAGRSPRAFRAVTMGDMTGASSGAATSEAR